MKEVEGVVPVFHGTIEPIEHSIQSIDFAEMARSREETRLWPYYMLGEKLDRLVAFTSKTNKDQTSIAGEIRTSGASATKFSKRNIILTLLVIVIAIYAIYKDIKSENSLQVIMQSKMNSLSGQLSDINGNLTNGNHQVINTLKDIRESLEKSSKQENAINRLLEEHSKNIDELKRIIVLQKGKINTLEEELKRIDQGNKAKKK